MRVMTYNIRGGWGMDGQWSTERIADVVLEQAPDILCLQEVHQRLPQSRFVDQPGRLQKALGLPVIFQANLRLGVGGYGLALVSRYPVNTVHNHLLPSVREQRGALEVNLTTPTGLLTVFCTHWGLNGAERERQAARLAELVLAASGPVLVCGDFNENCNAPGLGLLLSRTGLQDADADKKRLTYPADTPAARIDYILYPPDLSIQNIFPVSSLASDHLPLVADL
jgi:endonuclease/exonuclease/phosphatase family metal-dependent hydrolase